MSSINAKILVTRGKEIDLPGSPITLSPLSFSEAVEVGQFVFTTDTGRLFIGHSPKSGDVNYRRPSFPYQNIEVLTENSPRTRELFSDFIRNQNENDFYVPTTFTSGSAIAFSNYSGNEIPTRFYSQSFSANVEYHIFDSNNVPQQCGVMKIIVNYPGTSILDSTAGGLGTFALNYTGTYWHLIFIGGNDMSGTYKLYIRRTVLTGITNGELV